MDKYYLAKVVARERKQEIDHDLATRHMLEEANGGIFKASKTRRLVRQFAPVVIVLFLIAFFILA